MLPFVAGALALAWWAYGSGLELAGFHRKETQEELSRLREQVEKLTAENRQLTTRVAQYERQVQIEQASNQEMTRQLKSQADENTRLLEDLAFFQNLTAARGKEGELALHRTKLERDKIPGEYRLRLLLVQSGQRVKEFTGSYQLVATVQVDGQRSTYLFPRDVAESEQFRLSFKYYQRIEQTLQFPQEAQLESIQIRVFEQGANEPRVRQDVGLS